MHLTGSLQISGNKTHPTLPNLTCLMRPTLHISSPPAVSTASEIPKHWCWNSWVPKRSSKLFLLLNGWRSPKFPKRKICLPVSNLASSSLSKTLELLGGVVLRIPNPNHQSCPIHPCSKLLSYWAKLAAQSRLLSYAGTLPSWKVLSNETRTGWCCWLVAENPEMEVNGKGFSLRIRWFVGSMLWYNKAQNHRTYRSRCWHHITNGAKWCPMYSMHATVLHTVSLHASLR